MSIPSSFVASRGRSENSKHITNIFLHSVTAQWLSDHQFSAYASTTVANDYGCPLSDCASITIANDYRYPHSTRYALGSRYDAILAENEELKMELNQLKEIFGDASS